VVRQVWLRQTWDEQTFPQRPQLVLSVFPFVSHPSRAVFSFALQSKKPAAQVGIEQVPAVQLGVPFCVPQARPQPPQLPALV
jgi:hypothetical protein